MLRLHDGRVPGRPRTTMRAVARGAPLRRVLAIGAIFAGVLVTNAMTPAPAHAWNGQMSRITVSGIHYTIDPFYHDRVGGGVRLSRCEGFPTPAWNAGADELNSGFGQESQVMSFTTPDCRDSTLATIEVYQSWYRDWSGQDFIDVRLVMTLYEHYHISAVLRRAATAYYTVSTRPGWSGWIETAPAQRSGSGAKENFGWVHIDFQQDWVAGDRTTCDAFGC